MTSAPTKPDFPDWLSPMLVKELRQGMRSRVFLICFLAVQAAMIFPTLIGLLSASINNSTTEVSVFFWIIIGTPLLLIMPSSGLHTISREKAANTLELIFLTRLTARRIVFGKWVAIVAQALLLRSSVLPYAVLRYYLGGIDLAYEMQVLGWMVVGSLLLTALTVGLSPAMGRVARIILPIGLVISLWIAAALLFGPMGGTMWSTGANPLLYYLDLTLQSLFLMLLMLEVGAGKIGPVAENHSTTKRLLAVASLLTAIGYSCTPGAIGDMSMISALIIVPVLVGSVCEPDCTVPSVYRPFVRKGIAGRVLGRLFYPGWASGVFLSQAMMAVITIQLATYYSRQAHGFAAQSAKLMQMGELNLIAVVGTFFMPVAFLRLLKVRLAFPTVFYLLFQGMLALLSVVGLLFSEYGPHINNGFPHRPAGAELLIDCIPICSLLHSGRIANWDNSSQEFVFLGNAVPDPALAAPRARGDGAGHARHVEARENCLHSR